MNKRRNVLRALVVVSLSAVLIGVLGWGWRTLNQRRSAPYALDAEPVVGVRIYSMSDAKEPPDSAPRMRGWKVIGDRVKVSPATAIELRDIFRSPSTYTMQDSDCFEPGMAISFGDSANRVDVLICLLCNRAVFYYGDSRQGRRISDEGNRRLSSIYQRIFQTAPPQL